MYEMYLPTSISNAIKRKVFSDPFVDLTQTHFPLGAPHGQADEGGVGERGLGCFVCLEVGLLQVVTQVRNSFSTSLVC